MGITELAQIKVSDLATATRTIDNHWGVSFRTTKIEPLIARSAPS